MKFTASQKRNELFEDVCLLHDTFRILFAFRCDALYAINIHYILISHVTQLSQERLSSFRRQKPKPARSHGRLFWLNINKPLLIRLELHTAFKSGTATGPVSEALYLNVFRCKRLSQIWSFCSFTFVFFYSILPVPFENIVEFLLCTQMWVDMWRVYGDLDFGPRKYFSFLVHLSIPKHIRDTCR